jgi:hypothetical protein
MTNNSSFPHHKMTPEEIAGWKRIFTLIEEITRPEPPPSNLEYFRRAFHNMLGVAIDRQVSLRLAARWIAAYLVPAKKRISVYSLKHTVDWHYQAHGRACYLTERDLADVLKKCGFRVADGYVCAKEVNDGE